MSSVLRSTWFGVATCTLLLTTASAWSGTASVAQAAPPDSMPVWRLQVRFVTSNADYANTDDSVKVELNGANRTWIDSGRDDFERNKDETYDLRTEGINTLADIDFFRVEKGGSDGWALRHMQLLVNGVAIYAESFGPLWLDNDGGHSRVFLMDDYFMRQRSNWANYAVPVRSNVVPVRDMERRIEALTGDFVHGASGTNFIGGDHGVEMFTMSTNSWRVDLDLEDEKQFPFPDLEFDVDFDLTVSCVNNRPRFTVANVNTDASWPEDDGGSGSFAAFSLAPRLNDMMKNYTFFRRCPNIVLAPNGDLHFNPRFPPIGDWLQYQLVDTCAPIALHVSTGGETKPDGEAMFVATAKSTLKQDEKVEISFELPPQVVLLDTVIEVQTGKETYKVEVTLDERKDGSSRVAFSDVLIAGSLARYTLPLMYKSGKESTGQIKTVIRPLDEKTAATITELEAVSWFEFYSDLVVPLLTSVAHSRYIEDLPGKEPTK